MKRITRISVHSRPALLGAVVMLALTSASVAAADDGPGPLGVTADAAVNRHTARIGALFGADRANSLKGGHFCTGSVVHSPQGNLIVTAAHCVGGSDTNLLFAPGYRDGRTPFGVWKVTKRYLPDGWAKDQDEDSDIAFAAVEGQGGRRIEDVVGGNRFMAGTATGATAVTVVGYPDSREVPIRCTNKPTPHSSTQQRIACPAFTAGTSGSPWINGDGQVVGVLGGHEQGGSTDDVSYSVVLGREAAELYRDATSGG
ncbi:trypsin-like peptidase domain-containing protein [Streptomyces sp. FXJ1.172]|uniref:trypsin-like serine peptidase n=1 Tax=Streptomyces sp. FXJ1.172 TaxID=710705 RepID=UPI0007CF951E|nr:trypsin-like peptidase domain-containing protein [Streptomyces sp. FXJ1.172]WEO96624.1 trypsin-like peptidase domain-containing protein [Streptomyces sp. FXJ1.172]